MTISEYIRILVDNVFDDNLNYRFTIRGLSDEILKMTGEYFSYTQIYNSIAALDYDNHHYTRDVSSKPYYYEKISL